MIIQSYHFVIKGLDCSSSFSLASSIQNCRCKTLRDYGALDVILTIYIWRLFLMTLVPLITIITVNTLIMSKLFGESALFDHTHTSHSARRKTVLLYKISRMLVIVSSIYLLLHVPGSTFEIIKYMLTTAFQICNAKLQYYLSIIHDVFDLLTNFNYGINFYLYIISGQHIRSELLRTFKHSTTHEENIKLQRSSYFMSSYINHSKNNQPNYPHVQLSKRLTGSSI